MPEFYNASDDVRIKRKLHRNALMNLDHAHRRPTRTQPSPIHKTLDKIENMFYNHMGRDPYLAPLVKGITRHDKSSSSLLQSHASRLVPSTEADETIVRQAYLPGNKIGNTGSSGNTHCLLPSPNSRAYPDRCHHTGKNSGNISGKIGKANTSRCGHTRATH